MLVEAEPVSFEISSSLNKGDSVKISWKRIPGQPNGLVSVTRQGFNQYNNWSGVFSKRHLEEFRQQIRNKMNGISEVISVPCLRIHQSYGPPDQLEVVPSKFMIDMDCRTTMPSQVEGVEFAGFAMLNEDAVSFCLNKINQILDSIPDELPSAPWMGDDEGGPLDGPEEWEEA